MSKMGAHYLETVPEVDGRANLDPQDVAYWNFYCSAKECLTQRAYMEQYGQGDFESFCKVIDEMNEVA